MALLWGLWRVFKRLLCFGLQRLVEDLEYIDLFHKAAGELWNVLSTSFEIFYFTQLPPPSISDWLIWQLFQVLLLSPL